MTAQLAFDLPAREAWSRADFFTSPANAAALQAVEQWRGWPGGRMLLLGPSGAGKTHLAHVWASEAGAIWLSPETLGERLAEIASDARVIIDGAQRVAGRAETELFYLYNRLIPNGFLMLTAPVAPRDWRLGLPDLLSRLQAMPVSRLEAPDDDLLAAVLVKLLADRQITAPANLIPYLLPRMERSIAAARALVAALDARSLATRRPITRQLAAEVLDLRAPE
ncbi:chromosomal replication initiator DnaA [bacterium]|nr:chromosomal replication initiator DnaA [bacterium]